MFRALALALAAALVAGGCDTREGTDRWTVTENTNVEIDWDKVHDAYKAADGPEDFEKRVNEIYEGDEIISVAVKDEDNKTQLVTGFFDKNRSGSVDDGEKIFSIKRVITGEGTGQVQVTGYGPYSGYSSPIFDIAAGMFLGSMISRAFMPSYAPIAYTTTAMRASTISSSRASYREANPARFSKPSRTTGRSYGGGRSTSGGSRGGARFGTAPGRTRVRLTS